MQIDKKANSIKTHCFANKLKIFALVAVGFFTISPLLAAESNETVNLEPSLSINAPAEIPQDAKNLANILANTLTYQAEFEQSVYRDTSAVPEVTIGRFLIQRPNHFKWQTITPYQQSIIADGKYLWNFDPELEQVTIRNQQSVLADSPLLLLTSSVESLVNAFEITEINNSQVETDSKDEQHLFALKPRENGLFESVHILIENNKIKELFMVDTLGGRTSVKFSQIMLNEKIEIKEFIFTAPEGIDVIDSRENTAD